MVVHPPEEEQEVFGTEENQEHVSCQDLLTPHSHSGKYEHGTAWSALNSEHGNETEWFLSED